MPYPNEIITKRQKLQRENHKTILVIGHNGSQGPKNLGFQLKFCAPTITARNPLVAGLQYT